VSRTNGRLIVGASPFFRHDRNITSFAITSFACGGTLFTTGSSLFEVITTKETSYGIDSHHRCFGAVVRRRWILGSPQGALVRLSHGGLQSTARANVRIKQRLGYLKFNIMLFALRDQR